MPQELRVLSLRELNRALLARQLLLERARIGVVPAVERLAGLQAQWAPSPYVALWSRIAGFERAALTRAIDRGDVVKATLMRVTLHLVSAREYTAYAEATREGRVATWRRAAPPDAPALRDIAAVHDSVLRALAKGPRTRAEVLDTIRREIGDADERGRRWLAWAALGATGVLWDPTSAHWVHRSLARFGAAPPKLRGAPAADAAYDLIVRRHLGAFGPASVADVATWGGLRAGEVRASLARLRGITRFRDERGRELFDLSRAPRPAAEVSAPPRFLARFDAAILGHAAPERTRILPEPYRKRVIFAGEVCPTFLVDGFVAGRWRMVVRRTEAVVELEPFARLARPQRDALVDEGERLARFYAPEARTHGVRIAA